MVVVAHTPEDRDAAKLILSALIDARLDVRRVEIAPGPGDRSEALHAPGRCVLLCLSRASDRSEQFQEVQRASVAAGSAIGILCDETLAPERAPDITVYNLAGWLTGRRRWRYWFSGRIFLNEVVAASRYKVAGEDPPPPSAPRRLLLRQLWIAILGISGVAGTASAFPTLHDAIPWPRFTEERAWRNITPGSCAELNAFRRRFPEGRHSAEADAIFDRALLDPQVSWVRARRGAEMVVAADPDQRSATEVAARADLQDRAAMEAQRICDGRASAGARLISAEFQLDRVACRTIGAGHVCFADYAQAWCVLEEPLIDSNNSCWK